MGLRDEIEEAIRAWNAFEVAKGREPVIDFDCYPTADEIVPATSRVAVYHRLRELREAAEDGGVLAVRLNADLAYLGALLGEQPSLDTYLSATQGCGSEGWPDDEYVTEVGERAQAALASHGVGWHATTDKELAAREGELSAEVAAGAIREAAAEYEPCVREITGSTADFRLRVETTDVDAYWAYWMDGAGQDVRLRLNRRHANFTVVRARQFAVHEVLGHGLQYASLSARCQAEDVPWVRLLSVTAPHQMLFEGLASALPLFAVPEDKSLVARVRLDHYLQLVRAELHVAICSGASVADGLAHGHARVPWWTDEVVADHLTDCGTDPRLRSYLWSYPAGLDWFVALADQGDSKVNAEVLHAAYREPLTPADLAGHWPAGPFVRRPGGPVRLRQPALSSSGAHAH